MNGISFCAGVSRVPMTGATICSGIGAPETAMPEIEWRWCAEIDKFASEVLAVRYSHPNLGDVTAADFIPRAAAYGPIDVLVAGTPCQAFSVAGQRRSLDDDRGNITLRFVEIVNAIQPRFVLWENVPGVLNTSDNAFGCFLGALVGAQIKCQVRGERMGRSDMTPDWDGIESDVVRKLRLLRMAWEHTVVDKPYLRDALVRDFYVPLTHLAAFCAAVIEEEE